jgi:hypothetical protein
MTIRATLPLWIHNLNRSPLLTDARIHEKSEDPPVRMDATTDHASPCHAANRKSHHDLSTESGRFELDARSVCRFSDPNGADKDNRNLA